MVLLLPFAIWFLLHKRNIFGYTVWHNGFRVELRLHIYSYMQIWMKQVSFKKNTTRTMLHCLFYLCSDECGKYSFSSLNHQIPNYAMQMTWNIWNMHKFFFCIFPHKTTRNGASPIIYNVILNILILQYSYYSNIRIILIDME